MKIDMLISRLCTVRAQIGDVDVWMQARGEEEDVYCGRLEPIGAVVVEGAAVRIRAAESRRAIHE